ncbi:hypothetical protein A3D00_04205 [Candidatus Woesebacteria bacterium RIFCSPHIGHO2_02_FULL_38_9]|uniref:Uncharacterized protein n=1 Tax=Candidatus Woesebacteria bacterium RIFCSPHIGHO2_01_FULL_39_28 TaxID=1802496 RepID=A0A1F7YDP9_9BACT|nr:MAG: hypothetical protein A2627_05075 [Candidatus Woesebacteria bacterium RIFCSPHIGHO2_01_FULL_39_28]OGM33767.1 MAG: hypothetical protein A3D00_04205 [Candidatus Woesebacteria bacterium RIFCSPHIGHO2_02_FULL_38_9]OGM57565.1 MAG: hypothetical protein A3A50_06190 [Candidatus Woesebacteria bacterium RIFCSPLOWO2_01_FULL_38_20]
MTQKISEEVSVILVYDHKKRTVFPKEVVWNNRSYLITKLGLHHTYRKGRTLYHIFSVVADTLFLRLKLDSETLHWKLEEISDGL